ncbi:MAG: PAS domain S-box protein [Bacteroidales bacterium]|nr:PAS domain S-box protein [Bacteroidales bacterium]
MRKKTDKLTDAAILRQKAEEKLKKQQLETSSPITEGDLLKLVHELQVHQIELEMQNEELVVAKEKAELAEEKYTELYDFAPTGYLSLSKDSEIKELNFVASQMLGKDRSQLINKRFGLFISSDTKTIFNMFFSKVFSSKLKQSCEVTLSSEEKLPIYVILEGVICHSSELCIMTIVDITEKKKAEENLLNEKEKLKLSEKEFKLLAESMPQIVWITRADGLNIYFNQQWVDYTGLTLEESYGEGWNKPFHPNDQQNAWLAWQNAVRNNDTYSIESRLRRKDGIYRWWLIRGVPVLNKKGEIIKWFGTCTDIHEMKQTELELIAAKERAEESDKLKSAFLANMSHEIRTPMNGILGFTDLLKDTKLSGDQQQMFISIIEKSGARMLNIINDIISISKIESGLIKININKSNINEQIEYIYTFFKPEVEAKGMELLFKNSLSSDKAIINTDREKLFAILTNLVKNAIKYSEKGSIELGYDKKGEFLEFYVKDTGIGIDKDRQKAIFERFIQADIADKHAYQGAGLGLSISKAFVEMLGGKLWVESEKGKGSIFYFTIPYNIELKETVGDTIDTAKSVIDVQVKNLKVLIVDDDEISDLLISIMLKKHSREILHATNGAEAIDYCRNNPDIDLILMDIKMPIMEGYETTRHIRQFDKNIIIVAQTAYALKGDREKAIEAGCNEHISKPIIKNELMSIINKYFKK